MENDLPSGVDSRLTPFLAAQSATVLQTTGRKMD